MKLYHSGKSLETYIKEGRKNMDIKDYVCAIPSAREYSIDEAMSILIEEVKTLKNSIQTIDLHNLMVTDNDGNTYTLAHEYVYTKDSIIRKPSTMFRHASSNPFVHKTVYQDNDVLVDMTELGVPSILNDSLQATDRDNFDKVCSKNPELLIECFILSEVEHRRMSNSILSTLNSFNISRPVKDITPIKELIEKDYNVLSKLMKHSRFYKYLCEIHGLKYKVSFEPPTDASSKFTSIYKKKEETMKLEGYYGENRYRKGVDPIGPPDDMEDE